MMKDDKLSAEVKSAPRSGNGRAKSRVSTLPGTDHADDFDVRRDGLPRVQSSDPERVAPPVPPSPPEVGAIVLSHAQKVNLLNAFCKVKIKVPKIYDPVVMALIYESYDRWIKSNIDALFNEDPNRSSDFTGEQLTVLRTMADQIIQRQKTITATPKVIPPKPPAPVQSEPLKEGVNLDSFRKANEGFLRELEKLDRDGPTF